MTTDLTQNSLDSTQDAHGIHWRIEEFNWELKRLMSVEKFQHHNIRIQGFPATSPEISSSESYRSATSSGGELFRGSLRQGNTEKRSEK